jgi:hypothetical protein
MKRPNAQTNRSKRGGSIQDLATPATAAAGPSWPAPASANPRRLSIAAHLPRPHTVQLCIHCRQDPAGFWVSHTRDQTVRRPWCLSCCQDLDPDSYHINPFDS